MTSALQRPHILIVSDDHGLSEFLAEGLIYAGFWTSVIASAFQALEVFRLRSFDLILLDAALGGIGTVELLRRLRGHSPRAASAARTDIPVLLLAANKTEVPPELSDLVAPAEVLVAPLEIEEIAVAINAKVKQWRTEHPGRAWADEAALGSQ